MEYGPTLTAFAKMQTTEVVIGALVNPSSDIAHGYDGTAVTLKDGTTVHGILVSDSDPLVVMSMGGVTQLIPADRVEKKHRLNRSLMLNAEQLGMDAQAVADLVAYLKGL